MSIISLQNISKTFGKFEAVKNLNIYIEQGRTFGFIGHNGAGKTTTLSMISGILKPNKGEIFVFGKNLYDANSNEVMEIKSKIGVVPEQPYVYGNMKVYDFLSFFADIYKIKNKEDRINSVLTWVNLSNTKNKKIGEFSKGMKQRASIARALLHNPEILILDEPMSGLDPLGIKEIRDIISEQKKEGKTIIISSHILTEIENISDYVVIMNKGEIVSKGGIGQILNSSVSEIELEIEVDDMNAQMIDGLKNFDFVKNINSSGNNLKISTYGKNKREISKFITDKGCVILKMHENKKTLEDAFIKITEQK
ncbi:putative Bacitracin transport ATP-binding protein BcrA [groundwater metagenome]|uniref:Putative Bacitracin transport ATP-binding protein BcrA n=1 Tax=groundwater metagenome TaxID=717931 RepID=A0A098E6T7_9ZZZZ